MSSNTNSKPTIEEKQQAERSAKRFYISLVLLLFAIQFTIGGIALKLAIGDPALAVVPDYHQAALNWDETRRASNAPERLGWKIDVFVSNVSDGKGQRAVSVELHDKEGDAINHLIIAAKIYRHAEAAVVQTIDLPNKGEGRYLAMGFMPQPGIWQLEMKIKGADEPMTLSRTLELEN